MKGCTGRMSFKTVLKPRAQSSHPSSSHKAPDHKARYHPTFRDGSLYVQVVNSHLHIIILGKVVILEFLRPMPMKDRLPEGTCHEPHNFGREAEGRRKGKY